MEMGFLFTAAGDATVVALMGSLFYRVVQGGGFVGRDYWTAFGVIFALAFLARLSGVID